MVVEKEKVLERKLVAEVKTVGGWAIKLSPDLFNGLPDRLVLLPGGKLFFAEIKETGKKPTRIQNYVMNKIRDLGFTVMVIDRSTQIINTLEAYGFTRRT